MQTGSIASELSNGLHENDKDHDRFSETSRLGSQSDEEISHEAFSSPKSLDDQDSPVVGVRLSNIDSKEPQVNGKTHITPDEALNDAEDENKDGEQGPKPTQDETLQDNTDGPRGCRVILERYSVQCYISTISNSTHFKIWSCSG